MKTLSFPPILAAVAAVAASFGAGMALVAPIQEAQAGKGGSTRATTTGSKINAGVCNNAAGKLYCVGPSLPSQA